MRIVLFISSLDDKLIAEQIGGGCPYLGEEVILGDKRWTAERVIHDTIHNFWVDWVLVSPCTLEPFHLKHKEQFLADIQEKTNKILMQLEPHKWN